MKKYAIVIEKGEYNLSAYVSDLPGCITTGRTVDEIERNMREAIELHLSGLRENGEPVPEPHTAVAYVELQEVARRARKVQQTAPFGRGSVRGSGQCAGRNEKRPS